MVRQWWKPSENGSLFFHDVDGSRFPILSSMDREKLETIRDFHLVLYFPGGKPTKDVWRDFFQKTPNLHSLQISSRTSFRAFLARVGVEGEWENQVLSDVFSVLQEPNGCAFRDKLKKLRVFFSCKNYNTVGGETQHSVLSKSLFLDVLPLFPNLRRLLITESFLASGHIVEIANAIAIAEQQGQQAPGETKSNTNLVSIGVPQISSLLLDPTSRRGHSKQPLSNVQEAFLTILRSRTFPGLFCIDEKLLAKGRVSEKGSLLPCELEGQLLLNHSGRYRFGLDPSLTKNLWPQILYRAWKGSHRVFGIGILRLEENQRNATGLYDLLRNCPQILQHLVEDCSTRNQKQKDSFCVLSIP